MNYKVVTDVDKFANKISIEMNKEYKLNRSLVEASRIGIRNCQLLDDNINSILIDYYYINRMGDQGDYLYLNGGEMIIRINDSENISLPFFNESKRESSRSSIQRVEIHERYEYNFVEINKSILEKICYANSIELRVRGKRTKDHSIDKCQGFIDYCRIFYNGLYNANISLSSDNSNIEKYNLKNTQTIAALSIAIIIAIFLLMCIL